MLMLDLYKNKYKIKYNNKDNINITFLITVSVSAQVQVTPVFMLVCMHSQRHTKQSFESPKVKKIFTHSF